MPSTVVDLSRPTGRPPLTLPDLGVVQAGPRPGSGLPDVRPASGAGSSRDRSHRPDRPTCRVVPARPRRGIWATRPDMPGRGTGEPDSADDVNATMCATVGSAPHVKGGGSSGVDVLDTGSPGSAPPLAQEVRARRACLPRSVGGRYRVVRRARSSPAMCEWWRQEGTDGGRRVSAGARGHQPCLRQG